MVSMSPARGPTRAAQGRHTDRIATATLAAALPEGFRDRQRGEWLGDLAALGTTARVRYLVGAARTLPSLRRHALRHADRATAAAPVAATLPATVARGLLIGLFWPLLGWIVMLPVRYYALDVPGRLARSGGVIDPQSVWPFEGTPAWTMPLWVLLHLGAWAVVLGGPLLIAAVALVGTAGLLRRGRGRRWWLLAIGVSAIAVLAVSAWRMTLGAPVDDGGGAVTLGGLGVVAGLGAVLVRSLPRRTRAALYLVGVAAVTSFVISHTASGAAMLAWFVD